MFRGLINDAKSAASALALKYLARASVVIPFIVAVGFGVAALTVVLVEQFGAVTGYLIVAGGFTVIGLLASIVVALREHEEEAKEQAEETTDTSAVASEAAVQAMAQTPIAALGALFTTPGGPALALGAARVLAKNIPLVVLIMAIVALLWSSTEPNEAEAKADEPAPGDVSSAKEAAAAFMQKPNGFDPAPAGASATR